MYPAPFLTLGPLWLTRSWLHHSRAGRCCTVLLKMLGLGLSAYLALLALAWLIPLPLGALHRPSSTLVFDRDGGLLQAFISTDDMWRIKTPLEGISPYLQDSLLLFEDRWFYRHPGVNPFSLGRALCQNLRSGRIVSGGSTITMQIARMMEPKRRTVGAKLWEMGRAVQLELRYNKRQLLEIYFNIAPYGGNIEGAAAAAWLYFGKEPSQLSLGEAALLTALPNSPTACRPDADPAAARAARDRVLARLHDCGAITARAYAEARREKVPVARERLPRVAPHFCRDLFLANPGAARLQATLDRRVQDICQDLLSAHVQPLLGEGITNGAAVVLDNQTHEILAMVGSASFDDPYHAGQVNGAVAPRSPGSALKPFLYALGLREGLISPRRYLEDVPNDYAGYAPENYDRTFNGLVSAQEALERSLNLPAVDLQRMLESKGGLYSLLEQAGVSSLRSRESYGLAIALGAVEITPLEAAALYSALACGGRYYSPRRLLDEPEGSPRQLLDEGSAYLITEILTGLRRPDLPACWEFTTLPRVAWKTGTSYGHRDAWSIGYNTRYTVAVWLGNFSGEGARTLAGAEKATPLLFALMNSLCRGRQIPWFERPPSVGSRQVCALSGQVPGPFCPSMIEEMYLVDRSPDTSCRLHRVVEIDAATGYRLPPRLAGERASKRLVYVDWPPRVAAWRQKNGYSVDRLPPLLPEWQGVAPGSPPVIHSPAKGCRYRLREGVPLEYQKISLEAAAGGDVRKLFWFVDGLLIGAVEPGGVLFYQPTPGRHRVVCQDDQGRTVEVALVVEAAE